MVGRNCLCRCCCIASDGAARPDEQRWDCTCKQTYYPGAELSVAQVCAALRDAGRAANAHLLAVIHADALRALDERYHRA